MTASLPATPRATALAALLDRWTRDSAGTDTAPMGGYRERALAGPLREFLGRPSKLFRSRLVELGFRLAGGAGAWPAELGLLVEALHAGSLIVDDIEDGSPVRRGAPSLHELHGTPIALNAGNWLYFWPQVLLSRMQLPAIVRLDAHERIARCLLSCHEGQALDLMIRVWEVPQNDVPAVVRAITAKKTAGLLELATTLGALAAGADSTRVDRIGRFGQEVGIALQMLDDASGVLDDARRHKGIEDLEHARATWVWAWLAEDLDARDYHALADELRNADRISDGYLARVRARVRSGGLGRARAQLAAAIATVRATGADDLRCHEVAAELAGWERRYVSR